MVTFIKLTAGLRNGQHIYTMKIAQGYDEIYMNFEGGSFGWLCMQVAKDSFTDALEKVTVVDETIDPR